MIFENYICAVALIIMGFYTMLKKHNLFKIVIGMSILDYGINLLIVTIGFKPGGTAPIFNINELDPGSFFVDPVPQALTLTSIVIGACVTALALALVAKLNLAYGTIDTNEIRRLNG